MLVVCVRGDAGFVWFMWWKEKERVQRIKSAEKEGGWDRMSTSKERA